MAKQYLKTIDLNLLKVFLALAQELNTTQAARRLKIAQPAVSRALAKLRDQLDDELFVRTKYGLKPTDKGQILCDKLPLIMKQFDELFTEIESFNPSTHKQTIRIAINNFLGVSLPALLHERLRQVAPNTSLIIENWSSNSVEKLVKGELDLGINYYMDSPPKELKRNHLTFDKFKVLVNDQHPLANKACVFEQLSAYPIVCAILPDWNDNKTYIEKLAQKQGIDLDVIFRSESIASLIEITSRSDVLFPTSAFLSPHQFPSLRPLRFAGDFPAEAAEVSVYTHYRYNKSPLYQWLIEQLKDVTDKMLYSPEHTIP
ncbi:LysR family transcriptional regulator [Vibrio sp. B1FLJ16]|uniref:LysR family transcriptional regulator n=1 Tax=Vibrio sp. B1FLJ16 TaxID=2751178 RepID=UPI0015F5DD72|nr:LysR family transcriptional regulator [Vibrio sp. B1FLJ16]CAD7818787.1 Transcriptional regulator [Vibrio sp. B1FLJ16]CAE6936148.1 Transcriptional regulator [Vibrio sp. B1FLJ16]